VAVLALALAPAGHAAPGNPGVPGPPAVIFEEDFENVSDPPEPGPPIVPGSVDMIDAYTGDPPVSMTYAADPTWISVGQCNGMVASFNSNFPAGSCTASGVANLKHMAAQIGTLDPPPAGAAFNHALTAWTSTLPVATTPAPTLETEAGIPLPTAGRFITFSVDVGVIFCQYDDPLLRFFLLDGNSAVAVTNNAINPCTDPRGSVVAGVRVGSYSSDSSILVNSPNVGLRLTNDQSSSGGNDYAYDNVRMLDATPQLDKEFEAPTPRGVPTTLTFTITNTSDLAAKEGWSFTDNLPAGLEVADSAATTTTCSNGEVTAAPGGSTVEVEGDLETNRDFCTATVEVVADQPGEYENCPEDLSDVVGLDLPACDTLTVLPAADLHLEKSTDPALVSPGGLYTYFVEVRNQGPDTSTGSTVTDTLPDGVTLLAYNQAACDVEGQTITCEVGALTPNNQGVGFTFLVQAPDTSSTCFDNTASIEGNEPDLDLADNGDTVRTCTPPVADLEIEKSGPAEVTPGGEVAYTLTVSNNGPDDAHDAVVTDELPAGLTNIQAPGCTVQGQTVTCNVGTVPSGGTAPPIQITATAPETPSTCFDNVASVDASEDDPDLSNSESEPVQTCTGESDLALTKTVASDLVSPGAAMTWTITVTNTGPDPSPGAHIVDSLPPNVSNVDVQDPRCTSQGNEVSCDIGPLNDGESTDIVVTGTAPQTPSTCFENGASLTTTGDPDPDNNADEVRACTTPVANLELTKTASAVVDPGGQVTWTLTVTNNGPDPSTGYTVTDTLPAGITNIQADGCTVEGQTVTCEVEDDLPVDGTAVIVITGDAPNSATTCFENAASVAGDEDDPDLDDNEASAETCTNAGADLQIEKVASEGPFAAGDEVTFTLDVRNNGPATAHNVDVTDDLPDSLTLVSASPGTDCTQTEPVTCTVGTLAPNATAEFTIVATIGEGQAGNQIENTACVAADEPDSFEDNDCDTQPVSVEPDADLEIEKTVAPKGPVDVGELITYTLTVTNNGPNDTNNVVVEDAFNRDVDVVSAVPEQGTCATDEPIVCQLGPIPVAGQVTITVAVRPLHDGRLSNDAVVSSEFGDSDPTNNEDDASVPVQRARLDVRKRAKRAKAGVGDVVKYEIVVRSRTRVPLRDVEVCDKVPGALDLMGAPGARIRGNKACWRLDLPPRATRTFKVRAKVKPTKYDRRVVNTAKVAGADVENVRDRERVRVKGEPPTDPGPCPAAARC
jgi:uncharacterized repeat protein (TIGR01451 family)